MQLPTNSPERSSASSRTSCKGWRRRVVPLVKLVRRHCDFGFLRQTEDALEIAVGNWMNGIFLPSEPHFDLDSLWLEPGASATLPREWHQVRHMPPQVLARLIFVFSTDYAARVDSCVTDCSALRVRHHKHRQFGKSTRDTIRTQQVPAEWECWLGLMMVPNTLGQTSKVFIRTCGHFQESFLL